MTQSGILIGARSFSRDITEFEYLKKKMNRLLKLITIIQKEIEKLKKQATNNFF